MTAPDAWRLSSRMAHESETPTGVVLIRLANGAQYELVARSFGAAAHRLKVPPNSITRFAWSRPPANLVQLPAAEPLRRRPSGQQDSPVTKTGTGFGRGDGTTDCTINCAFW